MNGVSFAIASSSFPPSLSTSTTASTFTPLSTVSPLVSSASSTVSPSITITTSSATLTASNIFSASPTLSSAVTYDSGTDSFPPSTASLISDSSPQSMSSSPVEATATATSSSGLTYLSSFASQISLYPATSAFFAQTNTTIGPVQTKSLALVSVTTSATKNVTEPLPTSIGVSSQLGSASATYTQLGTTLSSNSFFNNHGAVVGTFVVVAIFSTAIFACLCVVWRQKLRRRTRDRMLKTITFPGDDGDWGLQEGPHDQPIMSMISDGTVSFTPTYRSDALLHGIDAGAMIIASITPPVKGNTTNKTGPKCDGPFSDYFAIGRTSRGLTGLATTANPRIDSPTPSSVPSTPSIYPPSLPPVETETDVTMVHPTPISTPSINPPPRPPRRRPPPRSRDITEVAAMLPSPTTAVSFATNVPPSSSPYTPESFSPPTSMTDAKHKSSKLSKELHLLTPPLSISDHSQTDSFSNGLSVV